MSMRGHASCLSLVGWASSGSNLVRHLLNAYPNYTIINIDAATYAGLPGKPG